MKSFATVDSLTRCCICDAPVGINGNKAYVIMGENYCEFCGEDVCPMCGQSKLFDPEIIGCDATDIDFYPMHFPNTED